MSARRNTESAGGPKPGLRGAASAAVERPNLSVIVVVTKNPQPLDSLYEQFSSVFEDRGETFEFIFVGEPWTREHLRPVQALAEWGHPIRVFQVGDGTGESGLLLAARDRCRGELVVTLPSYQRIEPHEIPKLIDRVRDGAALASAARIRDDDRWVNRLGHWGFHFLLRRLVGTEFRDIASGVRVLRPEILDDVPLYGDGYRFLPLLAAREGFLVEEVEVVQHQHDRRRKVYSPGTYLRRFIDLIGLAFLSRFTQKPLRFFGLIGGTLVLVGATALVVLALQRFAGTALANRPALVGAVLLTVLGVQLIALGLIGEIIVHFSIGNRPGYRIEESFAESVDSMGAATEGGGAEDDGDPTGAEGTEQTEPPARHPA